MSAQVSRAGLVLASPLGRQLLASYVGWGPSSLENELGQRLGLGPVPGTSALNVSVPRRVNRGRAPRRWQDVPPEIARRVVGAAVEWRSWREQLADAGEATLLADLADETCSFGFRSGDEQLWGLTAHAAGQLRPVAEALVSAPGASRWWDPVRLDGQRFVEWDGEPRLTGPALEQAISDCMTAERAGNQDGRRQGRPAAEPGVRIGAYWWSPPGFAPRAWTTRAAGGFPALGLCEFFDTFLPPQDVTGARIWSVDIDPAAQVLEIRRPADWQDLVARFPRDVTGTHDGEWRYWGGAPGPWLLPDWDDVRQHYDAVHVTTGAVVSSAGVALPVGDAYTMLVAWTPDATLWLRDMTTSVQLLGSWHGGLLQGRLDDQPHQWTPETGPSPR